MKTCSKCGVEKSLDCFYRQSRHRDGLAYACKDCQRVIDKGRRKRPDPARAREINRRYRERNRDRLREQDRLEAYAQRCEWAAAKTTLRVVTERLNEGLRQAGYGPTDPVAMGADCAYCNDKGYVLSAGDAVMHACDHGKTLKVNAGMWIYPPAPTPITPLPDGPTPWLCWERDFRDKVNELVAAVNALRS